MYYLVLRSTIRVTVVVLPLAVPVTLLRRPVTDIFNDNSAADPVHAALNSSHIDIAECDRDLRQELRAHGDSDSEVVVAAAAAADSDAVELDMAVGAMVAEAVAAVGEPEPALWGARRVASGGGVFPAEPRLNLCQWGHDAMFTTKGLGP